MNAPPERPHTDRFIAAVDDKTPPHDRALWHALIALHDIEQQGFTRDASHGIARMRAKASDGLRHIEHVLGPRGGA